MRSFDDDRIGSIRVLPQVVRTGNAVTIIAGFPYRHVQVDDESRPSDDVITPCRRLAQIVLRIYKSPAEVLMGFDIDSCAVGFDGERVWCGGRCWFVCSTARRSTRVRRALPRAQRAVTQRINVVDLTRRSLTYEVRLYKYAKRGFAVAIPGASSSSSSSSSSLLTDDD